VTRLARREAIADYLMDARMDGPLWKPPSTRTYQEAMREYADGILAAIDAVPDVDMQAARALHAMLGHPTAGGVVLACSRCVEAVALASSAT